MKASHAIARIRAATHDISEEYTDSDCLAFLNAGTAWAAALLAALCYAPLLRSAVLRSGDTLPQDLIASAGSYPMKVTDGRVEILAGDTIIYRYYAAPQPLTSAEDELPFSHPLIEEAVLQAAIIRALERNEYDTTAEQAHLAELKGALAAVLGGRR